MAYTFRIHNSGTDAPNDGWQPSEELKKGNRNDIGINSINDSIAGGNAGKVGSSIPTPFARIYLFETAYDFVTANPDVDEKDATFYDQLVSQSLDLLQLIFEKGKSDKLKIYEWNSNSQVNALVKSNVNEGHKVLAEALSMATRNNEKLQTIRLIEYDGILLGGTSPMTLTYTSPNATRLIRENQLVLLSNDNKNQFFIERNVKHLNKRSLEFQKYIYWLVNNHVAFAQQNSPLQCFKQYVKKQLDGVKFPPEEFINAAENYPELTKQSNGGAEIKLSVYNGLVLSYNDAPIRMEDSDFLMQPSTSCFSGPVPVVLPTDGDSSCDGWKYTTNEVWKAFTTVEYFHIENKKLEDRYLPVNGAENQFTTNKYPWLTTDDFFEKSIVCLGFNLNRERFFFPTVQESGAQFLLPIRKEYFKYFTLTDLSQNLTCEVNLGKYNRPVDVTFRLKIKLKNKASIILSRKYATAQNSDYRIVEATGMSLGVFPFYRCSVEEDRKNEYSVYLYGLSGDTSYANLSFWSQNPDRHNLTEVVDNSTHGAVRTTEARSGFSKVYNLRNETSNSFDVIEVSLKEDGATCRGLAIPVWLQTARFDISKKVIISVDFGTSNTYVAFSENGNPQPLTITEKEQQMVLLNDKTIDPATAKSQYRNVASFGPAESMAVFLREFVPSIIGDKDNVTEDEVVDYPIKTATIEKLNFQPSDKLFSGISVGFNIDNEKTKVDSSIFKYMTNLKWNAEEHNRNQERGEFNKDRTRVRAFCDQTLWMIKNKLIMNGYSTEGQMMYFYPDSMSAASREIFNEAWNASVKEIFNDRGYNIKVEEELESISPFYSLQANYGSKVGGQKSIANIDIGGGTTDYFILDQSSITSGAEGTVSGKAYEASIFFAGNDLWGATYPESTQDGKNQKNGFVFYMRDMIDQCANPEEARKLYDNYDENKGMSDFSSFFFKNSNVFEFSKLIAGNQKFRFVIFLHYASIIYHLVEMLKVIKVKEPEFKYPEILTFTGKGSEYIKMLSKDENKISHITTELIRAFGIKDFQRIEIIPIENPKALTANGGIYKMNCDKYMRINLYDEEEFGAVKLTNTINTPYERVGKSCIGLPAKADGSKYMKSEVIDATDSAMAEFEKFAQAIFYSDELAGSKRFLSLDIRDEDYNKVMELARNSYGIHARRFLLNNVAAATEEMDQSVFFFAMKNMLIDLSMHYYDNYISKR